MAPSKIGSRFDFSLSTGNNDDINKDTNYYDQVLALSQHLINSSFKHLFESVEGVSELYCDDSMDSGDRIEGVLNAPTLMFNGSTENTTEVYYQLRIKEATATWRDKTKTVLTDWALSVRTNLDQLSLDDKADDTPEMKEKKKSWREDTANRYKGFVPGDYRTQRVFAALTTASWEKPNQMLSTCYDTIAKKQITLNEWKAKPENDRYFNRLMTLLGAWARENDKNDISCIGIKFELKEEKVVTQLPTFRPMHVYNQVYPYRSAANPEGVTEISLESDGKLKEGDFNCLAYCETVDSNWGENPLGPKPDKPIVRPLPAAKKLIHTGNLTQPASDGNNQILGSFVMDYRVFMQIFLLPQLQELCQATQLLIGPPSYEFIPSPPGRWFYPKYALGTELSGSQPRSAADDWFKFERQDFGWHRWSKSSSQSTRGSSHEYFYPDNVSRGFNDCQIKADSSVDVKWTAGESVINVSGNINYDYSCRFGDDREMTKYVTKADYVIAANWAISVQLLDPKDGVMMPRVRGIARDDWTADGSDPPEDYNNNSNFQPKKFEVKLVSHVQDSSVTGNSLEAMDSTLRNTLSAAIAKLCKNISARFATSGKFVYPGYGDLDFMRPKFTKSGNIIAEVDYKRVGPGGTIIFPKVDKTKKLVPPTVPVPSTSTFEASLVDEKETRLDWDNPRLVYSAAKGGIARLILRAANKKKEDLSFQYIKISLITNPPTLAGPAAGKRLFNDPGDWVDEDESIMNKILEAGEAFINRLTGSLDPDPDTTPKVTPAAGPANPTNPATPDPNSTPGPGPVRAAAGPPAASPNPTAAAGPAKAAEPTPAPHPTPAPETVKIKKEGNVFHLTKGEGWAASVQPLKVTVETVWNANEVQARITRSDNKDFKVPKDQEFKLVLQSKIAALGQYAVSIQESWKSNPSSAKFASQGVAVDYKMVQLAVGKEGKVETDSWDVQDRAKELAAKEAAAKQKPT